MSELIDITPVPVSQSEIATHEDFAKRAAADYVVSFVEDGMRLGLGTGSTAAWFVRLLAERMRDEGLRLVCVATSKQTTELANRLGIIVSDIDDVDGLDLVVDGADEFDTNLDMIKGGGAALLQEKIVATVADKMFVISDISKEVDHLGAFPLPVEVVKFGWEQTMRHIEKLLEAEGYNSTQVEQRIVGNEALVTDEGHYILDLHLKRIRNAWDLNNKLIVIPGVVETGLFINMARRIIVANVRGEITELRRPPIGMTGIPSLAPIRL